MRVRACALLLTKASLLVSVAFAQPIRYVKPTAAGMGDGSSWANASGDLQRTINTSASGTQVWVAAGLYKPTGGLFDSFSPKNGVAIYGGFSGTEATLTARAPINPADGSPSSTTLSGDIDVVGDPADNSLHVVYTYGLNNTAVLDGFVITGGNADGGGNNHLGGGMYNYDSSPTLLNCTFSGNQAYLEGGAIYNVRNSHPTLINCTLQNNVASRGGAIYNNDTSSPVLSNCTLRLNQAWGAGGAIFNDVFNKPLLTNCRLHNNVGAAGGAMYSSYGSQPLLTNCSIQSNSATSGGGVYVSYGSSLTLISCGLLRNEATEQGGAIFHEEYSKLTLVNCSLRFNSATQGGALYNGIVNTPQVVNCILYENGGSNTIINEQNSNVAATYSLFEQSVTGYLSSPTNLTTAMSPFVSTTSVALSVGSFAINTGNPTSQTVATGPYSATALPSTDLAGNFRIVGGHVDIGAFEYPEVSDNVYTLKAGSWQDVMGWSIGRLPQLNQPLRVRHRLDMGEATVGGQVSCEPGSQLVFKVGDQLRIQTQ